MRKPMLAVMAALVVCAAVYGEEAKTEKKSGCCCGAETRSFGCIDTKGLKALIDAKAPMVLLDTRAGKFDDGQRIDGAKQISPEASDAEIMAVAPSKDALVVAYCTNLKCPASKMLAEKMISLGYKNVVKYPGGIEEWLKAGNKAEKGAKP